VALHPGVFPSSAFVRAAGRHGTIFRRLKIFPFKSPFELFKRFSPARTLDQKRHVPRA